MWAPRQLNVSSRKFVVTSYECTRLPDARGMMNAMGAAPPL